MTIEAVNPATGQTIARYEPMEPQAVARAVDEAHRAFVEWRRASFDARAQPMRKAATILRDEARARSRA